MVLRYSSNETGLFKACRLLDAALLEIPRLLAISFIEI
jgi:hypothetical protein